MKSRLHCASDTFGTRVKRPGRAEYTILVVDDPIWGVLKKEIRSKARFSRKRRNRPVILTCFRVATNNLNNVGPRHGVPTLSPAAGSINKEKNNEGSSGSCNQLLVNLVFSLEGRLHTKCLLNSLSLCGSDGAESR